MPNMKPLSHTVQKLERMLKLTTDKQTNRQDENNMTPIIRSGDKKSSKSWEKNRAVIFVYFGQVSL